MARLWLAGILLAAVAGRALPGQADGFLSCMDHLPLVPGLGEAAEGCLNFDTVTGRVVLAEAHGPVSADEVRRFYREALPAFGWEFRGPGPLDAVRAGERLRISIMETEGRDLRVHYALAPSPGTE